MIHTQTIELNQTLWWSNGALAVGTYSLLLSPYQSTISLISNSTGDITHQNKYHRNDVAMAKANIQSNPRQEKGTWDAIYLESVAKLFFTIAGFLFFSLLAKENVSHNIGTIAAQSYPTKTQDDALVARELEVTLKKTHSL